MNISSPMGTNRQTNTSKPPANQQTTTQSTVEALVPVDQFVPSQSHEADILKAKEVLKPYLDAANTATGNIFKKGHLREGLEEVLSEALLSGPDYQFVEKSMEFKAPTYQQEAGRLFEAAALIQKSTPQYSASLDPKAYLEVESGEYDSQVNATMYRDGLKVMLTNDRLTPSQRSKVVEGLKQFRRSSSFDNAVHGLRAVYTSLAEA